MGVYSLPILSGSLGIAQSTGSFGKLTLSCCDDWFLLIEHQTTVVLTFEFAPSG